SPGGGARTAVLEQKRRLQAGWPEDAVVLVPAAVGRTCGFARARRCTHAKAVRNARANFRGTPHRRRAGLAPPGFAPDRQVPRGSGATALPELACTAAVRCCTAAVQSTPGLLGRGRAFARVAVRHRHA